MQGGKLLYYIFEIIILTVSGVFVRDNFIAAAQELFKWLFEVLIERDINDGIDHGVGVSEHVDPELVLF